MRKGRNGKKEKIIVKLKSTNVVASQTPEWQPTATLRLFPISLQVPHLHQDGAPGHTGDHQRAGPPQVPQVVQVHNSSPEDRTVDDNSRRS